MPFKKKTKNKTVQEKKMFVVLFNAGDINDKTSKMHQVITSFEDDRCIGNLLMKLHDGNVKVDGQPLCELSVPPYDVEVPDESGKE